MKNKFGEASLKPEIFLNTFLDEQKGDFLPFIFLKWMSDWLYYRRMREDCKRKLRSLDAFKKWGCNSTLKEYKSLCNKKIKGKKWSLPRDSEPSFRS